MDADLAAELSSRAPFTVVLVTLDLPDRVVRWTDGGFVTWGGELYQARNETGVLDSIEAVQDGVGNEATVCAVSVYPADNDAFLMLIDPAVQGAKLTAHFGAVDFETGQLIGEPDLVVRLEWDAPRLSKSGGGLINDCITEEARCLEPNEDQRQTDSFHQSVWPGEKHYEFVTGVKRQIYWRRDAPKGAIT